MPFSTWITCDCFSIAGERCWIYWPPIETLTITWRLLILRWQSRRVVLTCAKERIPPCTDQRRRATVFTIFTRVSSTSFLPTINADYCQQSRCESWDGYMGSVITYFSSISNTIKINIYSLELHFYVDIYNVGHHFFMTTNFYCIRIIFIPYKLLMFFSIFRNTLKDN